MPVTQRGAAGGIQMNKRDKARAMARVGGFYFGLLAAGAALILVSSPAVAQTVDEAMVLSVRDHPAVQSQNLEVDAADCDVDAAVSGYFPSPSLSDKRRVWSASLSTGRYRRSSSH